MATLQDGRVSLDVSTNKTIADNDSGQVLNVVADAKTLTLPAAAAGKRVTVRVGGVSPTGAPVGAGSNKTVGVTVAAAGTDTTAGLGATGTKVTLAKTDSNVGDEVTLQAVGTAWYVVAARGAWALA